MKTPVGTSAINVENLSTRSNLLNQGVKFAVNRLWSRRRSICSWTYQRWVCGKSVEEVSVLWDTTLNHPAKTKTNPSQKNNQKKYPQNVDINFQGLKFIQIANIYFNIHNLM